MSRFDRIVRRRQWREAHPPHWLSLKSDKRRPRITFAEYSEPELKARLALISDYEAKS